MSSFVLNQYIIILTTVPTKSEGEKLASELVDKGLAACVNIIPKMTSVYKWEEKVQTEEEYQLIIKTILEKEDEVYMYIKDNHSYETPEIISLSINNIDESYSNWLNSCINPISND